MDEYNFEVVQSFKYLGSIVNVSNDLDEEIKTRIAQGNKCFYALKHLFKSSLLNRSAKFRLYKTTIRSVVMYGSETWSLTSKQESTLECFERKILRMICGPMCEQNVWRIRTNKEISELFGQETITNVIKAVRLRWAGHVARIDDDRIVKRIFTRRIEGTRDCVEEDSKELGVEDWKTCSKNRQQWRTVVESAKTRLGC